MKTQFSGINIEVVRDISKQPDMDTIVNAANAELRTGGVAGAIHHATGPELEKACRSYSLI